MRDQDWELDSLGTGGAVSDLSAWKAYARQESGLGAELVTNGGFENWTSSTDVDNWTETIAGSSTINQETSEVYAGSNSLQMDIVTGGDATIDQDITANVGDYLKVTLAHKTSNAAGRSTTTRSAWLIARPRRTSVHSRFGVAAGQTGA